MKHSKPHLHFRSSKIKKKSEHFQYEAHTQTLINYTKKITNDLVLLVSESHFSKVPPKPLSRRKETISVLTSLGIVHLAVNLN